MVRGPGGPRDDKVPILASNGEFVFSADAVTRLGVPLLTALNEGGPLPQEVFPNDALRLQEGGLVGVASNQTSSINVNVNTRELADAISNAIKESLEGLTVDLDADEAVDALSTAITNAVSDIEVSLDTAGLDLGNNLGAAVRNRLELVEGSVESLREDVNNSLNANEVFTLINEQLNNIEEVTSSRLDRHIAETDSEIISIGSRISEAIDIANQALSQALARV